MARLARLYAPNTSQLVQVRFLPQVAVLLEMGALKPQIIKWLEQASLHYGLPVHAWAMTEDSLYLLSTPQEQKSVSQVVQALGRYLAASLRQGAVFASRYRSCLVEKGEYLLASMQWLEVHIHSRLHDETSFSSMPWHMGEGDKECFAWMSYHESYHALGITPQERQKYYRRLCEEGLSQEMQSKIQQALQGQWALGSEAFIRTMSEVASRRVSPARRGRPRKEVR